MSLPGWVGNTPLPLPQDYTNLNQGDTDTLHSHNGEEHTTVSKILPQEHWQYLHCAFKEVATRFMRAQESLSL